MKQATRTVLTFSLSAAVLGAVCGVARADALVTACASDTQSGAGTNLAQALATGGIIRFSCPPRSSIHVTRRYDTTSSTTLEGGDTITLDGQGAVGPFLTSAPSNNVILRRITLRGFVAPHVGLGRTPGSVLDARGPAELDRATIETSDGPVHVGGRATITDSAFVGNHGGYAVVITGSQPSFIERTRFTGNQSALLIGAGAVIGCDFSAQAEGAVRVGATDGPFEIRHSSFRATRGGPALALSQRSGRAGSQTITVRANVFQNNAGGAGGGAIDFVDLVEEARGFGQAQAVLNALAALPPANFTFSYNTFTGNHGGTGGAIAANLAHTSGLVSKGDVFNGNSASGDGGAIAVSGGALRISHSLFTANRAGGHGAALEVAADAQATLSNALVTLNTGPAGAITGAAVTLANVTIADNAASGLTLGGAGARIANVILARNRPSDCSGVPPGVFSGANLQSDATCPGVTTGDAYLDAFYVPITGSPALRAGNAKVCRAAPVGGFDLAFQERLSTSACALGAFEHPPIRQFMTKTDRREAHATAQDDFTDEDGYRPPPSRTP